MPKTQVHFMQDTEIAIRIIFLLGVFLARSGLPGSGPRIARRPGSRAEGDRLDGPARIRLVVSGSG